MKYIIIILLFLMVSCNKKPKVEEKHKSQIESSKDNKIDLSVLDSIEYILDWSVQDGVLKIRTAKDEINDELERLKYIQKTFYE